MEIIGHLIQSFQRQQYEQNGFSAADKRRFIILVESFDTIAGCD